MYLLINTRLSIVKRISEDLVVVLIIVYGSQSVKRVSKDFSWFPQQSEVLSKPYRDVPHSFTIKMVYSIGVEAFNCSWHITLALVDLSQQRVVKCKRPPSTTTQITYGSFDLFDLRPPRITWRNDYRVLRLNSFDSRPQWITQQNDNQVLLEKLQE